MRTSDHERAGDRRTRTPPVTRDDNGHAAAGEARGGVTASLLRLQRTAGNAAVGTLLEETSPVLDVVGQGGGRPLEAGVRNEMERSLGADFSSVRVHTGGVADSSAQAVGAEAYTVGEEIVFREGRYDPSSTEGRRTLAHELTHVEQQREGPVDGTPAGGGIAVSDPGDRFERAASASAERVLSGVSPSGPRADMSAASGRSLQLSLQRAAAEDEEMVEGAAPAVAEASPAEAPEEEKAE